MWTISEVAQLASSVAVVVAVFFGIMQVRHLSKTREIFSSAQLVHAMQTPEFSRGIGLIAQLPDAASPEHIQGEAFLAAQHVGHVLESLGVLVYYGILPLHLVDDLLGGYVRVAWRK